ncbi:hypothetical protein AB1Y20_009682 [Prymnesium parvum]|uniref:Methyltransferase FkbM domain-containing protein n=1 Tax=Prymnesium parvum TaxID=97485 RepID=A0AB34K4Z6_PRYPA
MAGMRRWLCALVSFAGFLAVACVEWSGRRAVDMLDADGRAPSTLGVRPNAGGGRRLHERPALAPGISVRIEAGERYKGQEGQDKWADEHLFHRRRRGVFVDLGCYDGITYSNTWYFEKVLNWSGVCVEPNPAVFARISSEARRSTGVQAAVSSADGKMPFVAAYMRSSLNATAVDYSFLASQGVRTEKVMVDVLSPTSLLAKYLPSTPAGTPRTIDYVNIDVEAHEVVILQAWPFESYCVEVFNIENQPPHGEPSILPQLMEILAPRGYEHLLRIGVDEVFRRVITSIELLKSLSTTYLNARDDLGVAHWCRSLMHRRRTSCPPSYLNTGRRPGSGRKGHGKARKLSS